MIPKKYLCFTAIAIIAQWLLQIGAYAQSGGELSDCVASPYPITITQANGSKLTIVGQGTMQNSWTQTIDGYSIVNKDGIYQYAQLVNGKLVPSGKAAKNPSERKAEDIQFLQHIRKSLKPVVSAAKEKSSLNKELAGMQTLLYPSTGDRKTLMLLIKFPNLSNTYTKTEFNNLMNQANYRGTGSFKDFVAASSFGKLTISTDVYGWYTAKNNFSYYGKQNEEEDRNDRAATLIREAVDAAEAAGVDFSKYDNDGDGYVDGLVVVHAGPGAEEGSLLQYIWSHHSSLGNAGKVVNYDGVKINKYLVNPERRLATNDMVGIGIFCHEFGHNLGIPDLYDTDGGSRGVGDWSLMGSAGWLANEHRPGNFCVWSRTKLGWVTPKVITPGSYALNAASATGEAYRINTSVANEYFLLENRKQTGLDAALPGTGMAIWHINTNKTSMYPPENEVNADVNLKGVDLEEADGLDDLDIMWNFGDTGDLFPGRSNKRTFSDATNPSAKLYTGANSGVLIKHIMRESGGKVWFTYGNPAPSVSGVSPTIETVGSQITIIGNNLTEATAVMFNNTIPVPFTVINPTRITTTVPPGAKSGKITIQFASATRYTPYFTVSEYCIPSYTFACTSDYITNFSINTLVNNNSGCSGEANNYKNYAPTSSYTTTLKTGQIYLFTVRVAGSNPQGVGIWIDFNNDKDFDDPGEFLYNHTPMTGSVTSQIVIPPNASTGLRRMRIRSRRNGEFVASQACQDFINSSGETEDYTISIGYPVPEYTSTSSHYHIDDFSFHTLQNNNSKFNGNTNNYILYPESGNLTTTVAKGYNYTLRVKSGYGAAAFGVWIDYNNDQDFADSGEFILQTSVDTAATSYTFTIPMSVYNGKKRLRVRSRAPQTVSSQEYWNTFQFGETEDYIINITGPTLESTFRINSGGTQVTTGGKTFKSDTYFTSPSESFANANTGDIANTTNDILYQTARRASTNGGNFSYTIPVINNTYEVRLHFAETSNASAGSRVFNVNLEGGTTELSNFDIYAATGGVNKAITKTYTVAVNDGLLDIVFTSVVGKAMISAISVLPTTYTRIAAEAETSPEEAVSNSNLNVYPVPSAGQVQIELTGNGDDFMTVDIFDAQGTMVRRLYEGETAMNRPFTFTVQAQDFAPGIYFVKVTSPTGSQTKKMIIIR